VSKTCAVSIPNNAVTLMQPAPADAHYLLHVIFNLAVRRQLGRAHDVSPRVRPRRMPRAVSEPARSDRRNGPPRLGHQYSRGQKLRAPAWTMRGPRL
jgi:hypothetical protein